MPNKTYLERKARGQCTRCPNKAIPNRVRCTTCKEITSDYCAGRRDIFFVMGKCTNCGKRPPKKPGMKTCAVCLGRHKTKAEAVNA